jgi:hypothetical protein
MERTESVIVQTAPDFENDKRREMATFGWNLQGRQEIHEEGEAFGRPSYLDSSTYLIKTTVHHYVKLHFVRGLNLPNLDKIRRVEKEYFGLPTPSFPAFVPGPAILLVFWWPFWILYFALYYLPHKSSAQKQLADVVQQQRALLAEASALTEGTLSSGAAAS